MSDQDKRQDDKSVDGPIGVDQESLTQLAQLMDQPVKRLYMDGPMTVIEFEDGQTLPLYGGGMQILDYTEPACDFCSKSQSEVKYLAAPPNRTGPFICPNCAVEFIELFAQNGVEINLNISKISPQLANSLADLINKKE